MEQQTVHFWLSEEAMEREQKRAARTAAALRRARERESVLLAGVLLEGAAIVILITLVCLLSCGAL